MLQFFNTMEDIELDEKGEDVVFHEVIDMCQHTTLSTTLLFMTQQLIILNDNNLCLQEHTISFKSSYKRSLNTLCDVRYDDVCGVYRYVPTYDSKHNFIVYDSAANNTQRQ